MKTWQTLLREGDPVHREPALTADSVDRMRRAVLTAEPRTRSRSWTIRLAVASALGLLVAAGGWLHQVPTADRPVAPPTNERAAAPSADSAGRRQLQFSTPGGTRVIWVFNSNFNSR